MTPNDTKYYEEIKKQQNSKMKKKKGKEDSIDRKKTEKEAATQRTKTVTTATSHPTHSNGRERVVLVVHGSHRRRFRNGSIPDDIAQRPAAFGSSRGDAKLEPCLRKISCNIASETKQK